jgi:hypothetical protein
LVRLTNQPVVSLRIYSNLSLWLWYWYRFRAKCC